MIGTYERHRTWSDRSVSQLRCIIGAFSVTDRLRQEDVERNTDLIVFTMNNLRFACRVRKKRYSHYEDVTIRWKLPSGAKTEFAKMMDGWGDYMIYGYADGEEDARDIAKYWIVDLERFRAYIKMYATLNGGALPGSWRQNADDKIHFRTIDVLELEHVGCIAASHETMAGKWLDGGAS